MHEGRRLKSLARLLLFQPRCGKLAKLVIDDRQQSLGFERVSLLKVWRMRVIVVIISSPRYVPAIDLIKNTRHRQTSA